MKVTELTLFAEPQIITVVALLKKIQGVFLVPEFFLIYANFLSLFFHDFLKVVEIFIKRFALAF